MVSLYQLKTNLQKRAAETLYNHKRFFVQWCTGAGKSGCVMEFLRAHPLKTLIVVPEVDNINNWREEFKKFNVEDTDVEIICYASLKNYTNSQYGLLCFDECPHADTDLRREYISTIQADYVIALGAVISNDEKFTLESVYGNFVTHTITISQAVEMGLLPPPTINVVHMVLDNEDKKYRVNGKLCTAKEAYDTYQQQVNNAKLAYDNHKNAFMKSRMLRAGNIRKRFLGRMKQEAMAFICKRLQDQHKRFLCFCSSIKQAEELGGNHAYTSKTPKALDLLNRFNNHEIDSLYCVGKLIEGQNLKDIQVGVIGQLGGTERISVQQCGRIMRSSHPVIYIPVFDGTKDDSFLHTLTNSLSREYIKHYKL